VARRDIAGYRDDEVRPARLARTRPPLRRECGSRPPVPPNSWSFSSDQEPGAGGDACSSDGCKSRAEPISVPAHTSASSPSRAGGAASRAAPLAHEAGASRPAVLPGRAPVAAAERRSQSRRARRRACLAKRCRRCLPWVLPGLVFQRVEVKAHDREDVFRRHQVGPYCGMNGEPVGERVQALDLKRRRAGVGPTGRGQRR
jgi:hypothetical protein